MVCFVAIVGFREGSRLLASLGYGSTEGLDLGRILLKHSDLVNHMCQVIGLLIHDWSDFFARLDSHNLVQVILYVYGVVEARVSVTIPWIVVLDQLR